MNFHHGYKLQNVISSHDAMTLLPDTKMIPNCNNYKGGADLENASGAIWPRMHLI